MNWALRLRCSQCGWGMDIPEDGVVRDPQGPRIYDHERPYIHCPKCGSTKNDDPRPGRLKPAAWWDPISWFEKVWEWNDNDVYAAPAEDELDDDWDDDPDDDDPDDGEPVPDVESVKLTPLPGGRNVG